MPPTTIRAGGRARRLLIIAAVVTVAAGCYAFTRLGSMLYAQDPLQRADAIFVLAGSRMERGLEAVDLYHEGWAPIIALTEQGDDAGVVALRARGIGVPSDGEVARGLMIKAGVPAEAIIVAPERHDNTAHEANTLRSLAAAHGWRRVIVISSVYHTRRAGFAVRREVRRDGVEVVVRATRYDSANPAAWWKTRTGIRWVASEAPKLILYGLGLGM